MRNRRSRATPSVILAATGLLAAGVLAAGLLAGPASAGAAGNYPVGTAATGYAALLADPGSAPPGVNVWSCQPSAAHPRPVVLLPGTLYTLADSFAALGPVLANAGYCVFGLDYGQTVLTTLSGGRVAAAGDIPASAQQLSTFVDKVRNATGAAKVDIVGWSQGGMMPRYYLRFLGGASKVGALIGLASSSHGTTLNGAFSLLAGSVPALTPALFGLIGCPACAQQASTAPFIATLNAGGDTIPGVHYAVIETTRDEVVTPYQSAFLSGPDVDNLLLQRQCPGDAADHLGIPYDSVAIQDVVNELGPRAAGFTPDCALALPIVGTP
ncbi:MAG: lipase family protein [Actinomycetota bacterium]|nr:lipase family protein [Actinomycetota bacterium]